MRPQFVLVKGEKADLTPWSIRYAADFDKEQFGIKDTNNFLVCDWNNRPVLGAYLVLSKLSSALAECFLCKNFCSKRLKKEGSLVMMSWLEGYCRDLGYRHLFYVTNF